MPLSNCEINPDLNWSKNCIIAVPDVANQVAIFSIFPAQTRSKCSRGK